MVWTGPSAGAASGQPSQAGSRLARLSVDTLDLSQLAPHWLAMLQRNIASDGFAFTDPQAIASAAQPAQYLSQPGCIIASPSYPGDLPTVSQDYVFHWVRDAAIVALELAAWRRPETTPELDQALVDYVHFSKLCFENGGKQDLSMAKFTIAAQPVGDWPRQNDGPALQLLALLAAWPALPPDVAAIAAELIQANASFIQANWRNPNHNLWEEIYGLSFFTAAVQLQSLQVLDSSGEGVPSPAWSADVQSGLRSALAAHTDGQAYYVSILDPAPNDKGTYDPNADIVAASIYGAIPCDDSRLLATAALLRAQWTSGELAYPINSAAASLGLGPLIGRYPGDYYDGNHVNGGQAGASAGHPWIVCTANLADLHYRLAGRIKAHGSITADDLSRPFFTGIGLSPSFTTADAITQLQSSADQMLKAIVYHSDHLELSEQVDRTTGYESSVRDLSWSYASCLSALRARAAL